MISIFSLNGVNAASDTATENEIFYIDVSQNTKWNVSASNTYDLYASFVKGNTILANQVCTYNVGGNSNICSVKTPAAAVGADKINLFVAPKGTTFPSTTSDTGYTRVYFRNTANWSSVYAYAWDNSGSYNQAFPGVAMTRVSSTSNYYYYDIDN
ncbi:MAG: starch-binding protein, partial [Oscillospiraceae bacterium]|nr:starch-binding protein [Oscillospiraceae bacterium]